MFIQGSAWFKQELTQQLAQLARFAQRGFVIAMVEYRPSTLAPFPAQIRDARTATAFMLQHAAEYRADPGRLVVWGDSSGGHTATMLTVTEGDGRFSDEETSARPLLIRGTIDFYGPTNLGTMNDEPSTQDHDAPDSPEGMVLGGVRVSEHPDLVAAASPLNYINPTSRLPPFLILHGDKDRLGPYGQSVLLYRKLVECGHAVEMYRVEGADHSGNAFWTADEPFTITEAFLTACCS
jgi:acetyl esterase/lipase